MKAINSSTCATGFAATQLAFSTNPKTRAFGMRAARREDRRKLKVLLRMEVSGAAEIQQAHIERQLKGERTYRDLISRVEAVAGFTSLPLIAYEGATTGEPDGSRVERWGTSVDGSARLIASCAIED